MMRIAIFLSVVVSVLSLVMNGYFMHREKQWQEYAALLEGGLKLARANADMCERLRKMIFFDTTEKKRARLAGYLARFSALAAFRASKDYFNQSEFLDLSEKIAVLRYELGER